ncbi:unnamed protein product [Peronospora effusa]|nr:unnamed protein product [Peronospora effusa]
MPTQLEETGVVNGAMKGSQAPQEPAQSHEPVAVGRSALAEIATTPSSKSKVVVIQATSTRRIKTIKGTSKRVALGSASVQEYGPMNELFEAVEDKMPEASSVEEGKIHEIVALVSEENVVDCCSSSTMDESVLETDKKKRFAAQSWEASKDSAFYNVLWKHRDVFPAEVPSRLPADRGIRHEIDLEPVNKYCVTKQ